MGEWQTGASRGFVGLDGIAAEVLVTPDGTLAAIAATIPCPPDTWWAGR